MSVTIKEVARRAGVSIATVSRVLNDNGSVTDSTRSKVLQAARALNYTPHAVARSLITSKTFTVGVLLPGLYGEFFSELLRGIDEAVQHRRYHMLVSSSHDTLPDLEAVLQAMSGRIDGLILMSPIIEAATLQANLPKGVPIVLLNGHPGDHPFASLNIDNYGGATAMMRHLLNHGHERIAIIKGVEGNYDAEERLRGYRATLAQAGLEPLEFDGDFREASGYEAAKRILETMPRPTALFALNDAMAIGAMRALREANIRIPDSMAVAGFDDIPVARYIHPALSSVHINIHEMGVQAVGLLLSALDSSGGQQPARRLLPTRLVIRESCGGHP